MKTSKAAKAYALASQGIFTIAFLVGLGLLIGFWIDWNSFWPALLATVGAIMGVIIFISYLFYILKDEEKEKLNNDNGTKD